MDTFSDIQAGEFFTRIVLGGEEVLVRIKNCDYGNSLCLTGENIGVVFFTEAYTKVIRFSCSTGALRGFLPTDKVEHREMEFE